MTDFHFKTLNCYTFFGFPFAPLWAYVSCVPWSPMNVTLFLEKHVRQIDGIIQTACRKKNITGEMARDFRSYVYEKLLENEGKRLKDFQGDFKVSWTGYLSIVITRLAIDFIKKHWGRWENSAAARALGEVAMKLETLMFRDRLSFSEASEVLLESPEYALLHRLSFDELDLLRGKLPDTTLKKLEPLTKHAFYVKADFESRLKEILAETEQTLLANILEATEIRLTASILGEWDLAFQGRMPVRRAVSTLVSNQKELEEAGIDLIESIADEARPGPLDRLLSEELETQLESFVDILFSDMSPEDWAIISFYLIDNLRISEIVRMIDTKKPDTHAETNPKYSVSSKTWKHVNKRILYFTDQLKQRIDSIKVDHEDREAVSQYCLYLIAKKIQKK